jgi:hypothetical protein
VLLIAKTAVILVVAVELILAGLAFMLFKAILSESFSRPLSAVYWMPSAPFSN